MPLLFGVAALFVLAGIYIVMSLSRFRESAGALEQTARELLTRLRSVEERLEDTESRVSEGLSSMRREQRENAEAARREQTRSVSAMGDAQAKRIKEIGDLQSDNFRSFSMQLTNIGESQASLMKEMSEHQAKDLGTFSDQLAKLSALNEQKLEGVRAAVEARLTELRKSNEAELEKMRATVDEQLHTALEKRLGEAFTTVSNRLEQVHRGLGEVQALTSDVTDLKKVLSNVKVRGTWAEVQLGSLLEQVLAKEQYGVNVAVRKGSNERVEFAVKLPGAEDGCVWLPIDSKFPVEDYRRIVEASESGDKQKTEEARKALRRRVLEEAKDIKTKYIAPPQTTDFGIIYLSTEGLYAEVLNMDGLCEELSRVWRVVPAGPATICALLNSLQMGFRTLAIQKRSSEVTELLGKVRTEFEKFAEVLDKARKKIDDAGKELDRTNSCTKRINRALNNVQRVPVDGNETFALAPSNDTEDNQ